MSEFIYFLLCATCIATCVGFLIVYRKDALASVNALAQQLESQRDSESTRIDALVAGFQKLNEVTAARYKDLETRAFAIVQQAKDNEARMAQALINARSKAGAKEPPAAPAPRPSDPIVRNGRVTSREPAYAHHEPNAEG